MDIGALKVWKRRLSAPLWRDAALVTAATAVAAALCARYNFAETLRRWTAPWARIQLDEVPVILLVLALGLTWFAARRYREASREIARRQSAETQLASILTDNRRLSQHYVELQEAKQRNIARELHDEFGQYLNVIKLDAVGIRDVRQPELCAVQERARTIVEICDHMHGALATLIRDLRPTGLDELGLAAALEHCVEIWRTRLPNVSMQLSISGDFTALPESVAVTLYRLVQEALTNVAKHADAGRVAIRLERSGNGGPTGEVIEVTITDDGVGTVAGRPTGGLGLTGMRERVIALQGNLAISSSPGGGFELSAHIPGPFEVGTA